MKLLTIIGLLLLTSCASVRRYQVGQEVRIGDCSTTIKQILSTSGYLVSGCGYERIDIK